MTINNLLQNMIENLQNATYTLMTYIRHKKTFKMHFSISALMISAVLNSSEHDKKSQFRHTRKELSTVSNSSFSIEYLNLVW